MNIYRMNEKAELPEYATKGSACFDIKACFKNGDRLKGVNSWNKEQAVAVKGVSTEMDAFQLPPGIRVLVPTGLIFDVPEKHVLKLFIRSGLALKKGLSLSNGTGIIDSDYTLETFIMLQNNTDSLVKITNGDRIAQGMLEKVVQLKIAETTKPMELTERDGGFGSTGE
jgi:deoxyuridine 5'-triphosphate nucleotidohydrolase